MINITESTTDNFANTCKRIFNDEFKKRMDEIEAKSAKIKRDIIGSFNQEIQNNIVKSIGNKKLFDYTSIPDNDITDNHFRSLISAELPDFSIDEKKKRHNKKYKSPALIEVNDEQVYLDKFIAYKGSFIIDEMIVLTYNFYIKKGKYVRNEYVFVSNYARIFKMTITYTGLNRHSKPIVDVCSHNFWIPVDYIEIINLVLKQTPCKKFERGDIPKVIKSARAHAKCGKTGYIIDGFYYYNEVVEPLIEYLKQMSLTVKDHTSSSISAFDIMKEKQLLEENKLAYMVEKEKFAKDRALLDKNLDRLTRLANMYGNIDKERKRQIEVNRSLKKRKSELKLMAKKVMTERKELDEEKRKFNQTNIYDLFSDGED